MPTIDPNTACATRIRCYTDRGRSRCGRRPGQRSSRPVPRDDHRLRPRHDVEREHRALERGRSAFGMRDASVIVRADAPIEGIEYAPTWASCTFHAGARDDSGDDPSGSSTARLSTLASPQPIDPIRVPSPTCAKPYVACNRDRARQSHAVGLMRWRHASEVRFTLRVALDEKGRPQHARVATSPSVMLNASALDAAMHTTYRPMVFRCKPVASGYEFSVEYSSR